MTDEREPTAEELAALEFEEGTAIAEAILDEEGAALLATVTAERDEYLDQLQRSRAEFANFRRRTENERQQVRETAARDLLAKIVPVLDDMQRAYSSIPADQVESAWAQGIAHIMRKFVAVLDQAGVAPIKALGEVFDPTCHEAVASEPNSAGTHVIEVYQTGYRLGGTLLRPAMVRVGNAPPAA